MNEIGAIAVRLDNRSYEYDVYTLVIAFFQGIPTRVFDPDQEIPQDSDLLVQIQTESSTQVCLKELCEAGAGLGSDVPFCVMGQAAENEALLFVAPGDALRLTHAGTAIVSFEAVENGNE